MLKGMYNSIIKLIAFSTIALLAGSSRVFSQTYSMHPTEVRVQEAYDISPPLSDMPLILVGEKMQKHKGEIPNQNYSIIFNNLNGFNEITSGRDPVLQDSEGIMAPFSTIVNVDGISNIQGYIPPDPAGDIGANHYLQATNIHFAVYSKTGALLFGPAALGTLWQGFPGSYTNDGDPVVFYDHLADRWIITQFSLPNYPNGPFYELIAVSQTPDPLGAWHRYSFQFSKMPDYPKFGVWADGYYMSANLYFSGSGNWAGPAAIVLERDSLLAGKTARMKVFELGTDRKPLLAADLDGPLPPAGSPGYFLSANDDPSNADDHLELFSLYADWANPANSVLTGPQSIPVATFDGDMCGGSASCIQQAGTTRRLDALSRYLMQRLQYRNFGNYQVLLANHTVDVDATNHAGIRWYELRTEAADWSVHQQGTYAPDTNHRWLGSIAMDGAGNIALAYSITGKGVFPSIHATGRRSGDAPGYMSLAEETIMAGTGAQNDLSSRWGDYSCLTVDPTDDRTFWYTNEYYAVSSNQDWKTRIASFTIDNLPVELSEKSVKNESSPFNLQNYPNPFSKTTLISWKSEVNSQTRLCVYDVMAKVIEILVNEEIVAGEHKIYFDASELAEGVYYYQLRANGRVETRKMVVCD
jgi:hypothetical protein